MSSDMSLLGQMWKEYSLSDSRYLTGDTFVVCMETVTAVVWGPLSFLCAYCILVGSPWRHPLQIVISLGQLYGDVLYYATCTFEEVFRGKLYSRPERYYYWVYYIFLNAFWIVIPLVLLGQSLRLVTAAIARSDQEQGRVAKRDQSWALASKRIGCAHHKTTSSPNGDATLTLEEWDAMWRLGRVDC